MKTQELLKIDSIKLLSESLLRMKNKEHEKHARKLAKALDFEYEKALLEVSSIVIDAESNDDIVDMVYKHFSNEVNEKCKDADQLLLNKSKEFESTDKEYQKIKFERSRLVGIYSTLLLMILLERTNLVQNKKAIKTEMAVIKATHQTLL